jgi:hypothetical protein
MQNVFIILTILFLILTLTLIGVSFYLSQDSLVKFAPTKTNFYFHLNLNPLHPNGLKAAQYLSQHWPQVLIAKTLGETTKNNFKPETMDQLEEIAVFYLGENPIVLLKYKPAFSRPALVLGNRVFYRLLDDRTVALAASPLFLNQLESKSNFKIGSIFRNIIYSGFISTSVGEFYLSVKNNQIYLTGQSKNYSPSEMFSDQIDYLLQLNGDQNNSCLLALSRQRYTISSLRETLIKKIAYLFPNEITQKLPDDTVITELVSQSENFHFQKQKIGHLEIRVLKSTAELPALYLANDQNYIFLSSNARFLAENLLQFKIEEPCQMKPAEEMLLWSSTEFGVQRLILSSPDPRNRAAVRGCLSWY